MCFSILSSTVTHSQHAPAPRSPHIYLPVRSRHHMEMSLCRHAVLPGLGRLAALWFQAALCSAPLQRSCVPLVHFISPRALCKRRHEGKGGSTLPSQLPHDLSSKLSLREIKAKETVCMCGFSFVLHQLLNRSLTANCVIAIPYLAPYIHHQCSG